MWGTTLLIFPFVGFMLLFFGGAFVKELVGRKWPRFHDFIFQTTSAREEHSDLPQKPFMASGHWSNGGQGELFIMATSYERALEKANSTYNATRGRFTATSARAVAEEEFM